MVEDRPLKDDHPEDLINRYLGSFDSPNLRAHDTYHHDDRSRSSPADQVHTWRHVSSLPLSQQPSGTNSTSSLQLDGVSAIVEKGPVDPGGNLGFDGAPARSSQGRRSRAVVYDSSSEDHSESTSRTASGTHFDPANMYGNESFGVRAGDAGGPPSLFGEPLFKR